MVGTIACFIMWACAALNVYALILCYKKLRDLDRSYMLYNKENELLTVIEDLALQSASLGVVAFLEGGNEHDKGRFVASLQEFNYKLKIVQKEFMK